MIKNPHDNFTTHKDGSNYCPPNYKDGCYACYLDTYGSWYADDDDGRHECKGKTAEWSTRPDDVTDPS